MSPILRSALRSFLLSLCPPIVVGLFRKIGGRTENPPSPMKSWVTASHLHLGCGKNVIQNWCNIDSEERVGVTVHDLSQPLPVADCSVHYIFSEHFIEHLTRTDGLALLRECHRVLKPGGVVRVTTPDLRKLVDHYVNGHLTEWHDVNWFPVSPCAMMNEGLRLWGHQFLYDEPELLVVLRKAGFSTVTAVPWRDSSHEDLRNLECRPYHGEIILEGTRT